MSTLGTLEHLLIEAAANGLGHLVDLALEHVLGHKADDTTKERVARATMQALADQVTIAAKNKLAGERLADDVRASIGAIAHLDVAKLFTPKEPAPIPPDDVEVITPNPKPEDFKPVFYSLNPDDDGKFKP